MVNSKTKLKKYCMNNRDYGFKEEEFDRLLEDLLNDTKRGNSE